MNLLRGIPNRRAVLSWGSFDLANQSFTLLINTLLFGNFLGVVIMAEGDSGSGDFAWGLMGSLSLLAVAAAGPVLGALADARACKKKILIGTGILCALLTCCLFFLPSGAAVGVPLALTLACLLYLPANIAFNVGENFLASFLPEIADRKSIGRVSAIGWSMGYIGALILLVTLAIVTALVGIDSPHQYRPILLFAGLWFGLMIIPTFLYLPEQRLARTLPKSSQPVRDAFRQFGRTVREAARFRDLAFLLASFFVYGMGVQVIIFFAGVIAKKDFGFADESLFLFAALVTLMAGVSAVLTGAIQDRLGHKATLLGFLGLWILMAGSLLLIYILRTAAADPASFPNWPVWCVGGGIGFGLGGIGTGTRAAVGYLTPSHRTAEFFGLWGTTYKLAGAAGLPMFSWARYQWENSAPSLAVLVAFFVIGAILVWRSIDMERGSQTATEEEERFRAELADVAASTGAIPAGGSVLEGPLAAPGDLGPIDENSPSSEERG